MARTKDKYNALRNGPPEEASVSIRKYKVAIYARISSEHFDKPSESIENQISLIREFISGKDEFSDFREYIDRNYSGTNFKRPAFMEMMEDVREGRINCIIVKDLSRLGRDYLETSNYIETIFPFMGTRFISVNDRFDTGSENNESKELEVALKNLVNDMYAKDISKRIATVKETNMKRGCNMMGRAPYGYLIDKSGPVRKLSIDPDAASVVRFIFSLAAEGRSLRSISGELQKKNINTPADYSSSGSIYSEEDTGSRPWGKTAISAMLDNQAYIGHLVQGKTRSRLYEGEKTHRQDRSKWIVTKNTHEPIVSEELFNKAREHMSSRAPESARMERTRDVPEKDNRYAGLLFCGICGGPLRYLSKIRGTGTRYRSYHYYCNDTMDTSREPCGVMITDRALDDIVRSSITDLYHGFLKKNPSSDIDSIINNQLRTEQAYYSLKKKKESSKLKRLELKIGSRYESYVEGNCSKEEFIAERDSAAAEEKAIRKRMAELKEKHEGFLRMMDAQRKWSSFISDSDDRAKLDGDLLKMLISKIYVYPDKRIEIVYRFGGGR